MKQLPTARWVVGILLLVMNLGISIPGEANQKDTWVSDLTEYIPDRSIDALTGSQFVNLVSALDEEQRERMIEQQLLQGNLPDFLRKLKPIKLQKRNSEGRIVEVTLFVTPDYLAIGSQQDFIRIPMDYHSASMVAARFRFILPTRRMVDAIYVQSENRFTPQPLPPGPQMRTTGYYQLHNSKITRQRLTRGIILGELMSGHKKDVVISNKLINKPERVAIYGWHRSEGNPIQPLSTVHGAGYADYSHGVRLVSEKILVNGKQRFIYDVLSDPQLSSLLSDEGPLTTFYKHSKRTVLFADLDRSGTIYYRAGSP